MGREAKRKAGRREARKRLNRLYRAIFKRKETSRV